MDDQHTPTGPQDTAAAAQRLQQRPSLEDSAAQLQQLVEQIGAAATELVPGLRWEWQNDEMSKACPPPYDRTNGRILNLRLYVSTPNTPLPDDIWPRFVERVRPLAATVGATAPETMQDQTGKHDVRFVNPDDGTTIKIGSQATTVIGGTVGCRLPHDQFATPVRPTS
ncbi:LppA family lipoprotein [Nocardia mexicana]|uniref:Putative LppA-like lipoprotein n=1 Tax=Nocardia mexicana TaxID=279262 RepID=A0A370HFN1_9NOCA|nr:LppA family lipoprotein [Nocardia mexicana]RDI56003.1 putative LppA-like lipoprotein [Nocardia mexicana]